MTVPTGLPWWDDRTQILAWDTLIMAGEIWPGIANVEFTPTRKVDIKSPKGSDGATMTDGGSQPAKGKIVLTCWSEYDWRELQRLLPTVHPKQAGGVKQPVEIFHPNAALLGVTQIVILSIKTKLDKKDLFFTVEMDATEWAPAPKPAKPKETPKGTPTDEQESRDYEEGMAAAEDIYNDFLNSFPPGWI